MRDERDYTYTSLGRGPRVEQDSKYICSLPEKRSIQINVGAHTHAQTGLGGRVWSEENGSEFNPGVGSAEVGGHQIFTLIWLEPV